MPIICDALIAPSDQTANSGTTNAADDYDPRLAFAHVSAIAVTLARDFGATIYDIEHSAAEIRFAEYRTILTSDSRARSAEARYLDTGGDADAVATSVAPARALDIDALIP